MALPAIGVLLALLSASYIEGMPKGVVLGHEWGTAAIPLPLRLPLVRPIYLERGMRVDIEYAATLRSGRLSVRVGRADELVSLAFTKLNEQALSVSTSGTGRVRYIASRNGYYLFMPTPEVAGGGSRPCNNELTAFFNAVLAEPASCATYNVSYQIKFM